MLIPDSSGSPLYIGSDDHLRPRRAGLSTDKTRRTCSVMFPKFSLRGLLGACEGCLRLRVRGRISLVNGSFLTIHPSWYRTLKTCSSNVFMCVYMCTQMTSSLCTRRFSCFRTSETFTPLGESFHLSR